MARGHARTKISHAAKKPEVVIPQGHARARITYPDESLSPAFHIPLSDNDFKLIGELCAIQGQIELIMQMTVMALLKKSLRSVRKLMDSPNMTSNTNVWLNAVETHVPGEIFKELARTVADEIAVLREGRNDFVHAFYAVAGETEGSFGMHRDIDGASPPMDDNPAVAVHRLKTKPMGRLKETRDKAAVLSRFVLLIMRIAVPRLRKSRPLRAALRLGTRAAYGNCSGS